MELFIFSHSPGAYSEAQWTQKMVVIEPLFLADAPPTGKSVSSTSSKAFLERFRRSQPVDGAVDCIVKMDPTTL